jgi:hypothetical protein
MKTFLSVSLAICGVSFLAFAQLGPGNLKDIDSAFKKQPLKSSSVSDNSIIDFTPGDGPSVKPTPPSDGLVALRRLVAEQNELINAQRTRIEELELELKTCQEKLKK